MPCSKLCILWLQNFFPLAIFQNKLLNPNFFPAELYWAFCIHSTERIQARENVMSIDQCMFWTHWYLSTHTPNIPQTPSHPMYFFDTGQMFTIYWSHGRNSHFHTPLSVSICVAFFFDSVFFWGEIPHLHLLTHKQWTCT